MQLQVCSFSHMNECVKLMCIYIIYGRVCAFYYLLASIQHTLKVASQLLFVFVIPFTFVSPKQSGLVAVVDVIVQLFLLLLLSLLLALRVLPLSPALTLQLRLRSPVENCGVFLLLILLLLCQILFAFFAALFV